MEANYLLPPVFISDVQIQRIITGFNPHLRAKTITRNLAGIVNPVYNIQLTDNRHVILRILAPPDGARKAHKEAAYYQLLASVDVPTPELIGVRTEGAYGYMLSEVLPGGMLRHRLQTLTEQERHRVYYQLGDYLGRIHSLSFAAFGDVTLQDDVIHLTGLYGIGDATRPYTSWRAMLTAILESELTTLAGSTFADLIPALRDYLYAALPMVDYVITPRLLHMDYHSGNLFIEGAAVTGVLDMEEGLIGHNEYGLSRVEMLHFLDERSRYRDAFIRAYTQHITLDAGYSTRLDFYHLTAYVQRAARLTAYERLHNLTLSPRRMESRHELQTMLNAVRSHPS